MDKSNLEECPTPKEYRILAIDTNTTGTFSYQSSDSISTPQADINNQQITVVSIATDLNKLIKFSKSHIDKIEEDIKLIKNNAEENTTKLSRLHDINRGIFNLKTTILVFSVFFFLIVIISNILFIYYLEPALTDVVINKLFNIYSITISVILVPLLLVVLRIFSISNRLERVEHTVDPKPS